MQHIFIFSQQLHTRPEGFPRDTDKKPEQYQEKTSAKQFTIMTGHTWA